MVQSFRMSASLDEAKGRGMVFGTERCRKILDALDSPDKSLKIVHIAGTNGKGSVAEYISQIILASGARVGTFTSPAVYCYEDGFRVDMAPLHRAKLDAYIDLAARAAEGLEATMFEIETAAAIYAFYCEGCEWAVIECGLGGAADATNAVARKHLALITSIGLEHTAILGDTVEKICAQKAGIISDCPAVASALQPDGARAYFEGMGVKIADGLEILHGDADGTRFLYGGREYFTYALGCAQPYNAALAIAGAKILGMPQNAVYSGVNAAKPQGRLQVFNLGCGRVILDGAHNPASFLPLANLLKGGDFGRVVFVLSALADKDLGGNLAALRGLAEGVIAVESGSPRAMPLGKITEICGEYFGSVSSASSVGEALDIAASRADTVVVCGSFTILQEAKASIMKNN